MTQSGEVSPILALELRHLDLEAGDFGTLTLDPGMTKNGKPRTVHLTPELNTLLGAQVARTDDSNDTLVSSSKTINAFWRLAVFSIAASAS